MLNPALVVDDCGKDLRRTDVDADHVSGIRHGWLP
jgi:hypothetical protein